MIIAIAVNVSVLLVQEVLKAPLVHKDVQVLKVLRDLQVFQEKEVLKV
jgi:hypothetical protein